ncbi:MAG: transcription factor WhiB [Podoviridae sp. ctDWo9]|nr:MAG: transcription factor WhiB [Podoviridae sp. ctDWo9]
MTASKHLVPLVDKAPDWSRAVCVGVSGEVFFPDMPHGFSSQAIVREARTYCTRCPIQEECLKYACLTDSVGIWGGVHLSEYKTRKLRKENGWTLQRYGFTDPE